jgi:H+/Cl- antiporter ClcA
VGAAAVRTRLRGGVVWCTRRFAPGAAGSGIPQVMATLEKEVGDAERGLFVSLRLSVAKIVLTAAGLLGGLSLGREGPSVQIAAGIMLQARRFMGSAPRTAGRRSASTACWWPAARPASRPPSIRRWAG